MFDVMEKYGILGVEMEAAGIYGVAAEYGVKSTLYLYRFRPYSYTRTNYCRRTSINLQ